MRFPSLLFFASGLILPFCFFSASSVLAEECCDPESPFRLGEGYPDIPATCETAKYWIDHAPDTYDRISFAIKGEIVTAEWDGALAYLIMCDKPTCRYCA